jgi:hypothetical protein
MTTENAGNDRPKKRKWDFEIAVYQDRFVIAYFALVIVYLLIGSLIFIFPIFTPSSSSTVSFRFSLMYIPLVYHLVVSLAVLGIAMRARWALKFYPKAVKSFMGVLVLCSIVSFTGKHGLGASILITMAILVLLSPCLAIVLYGLRYIKRGDVLDSFEKTTFEYRIY